MHRSARIYDQFVCCVAVLMQLLINWQAMAHGDQLQKDGNGAQGFLGLSEGLLLRLSITLAGTEFCLQFSQQSSD
jgi:hypothetical protein